MTKQQILQQIKTITTGIGLSGYYTSLPKQFREDEDIIKALKERRKEL